MPRFETLSSKFVTSTRRSKVRQASEQELDARRGE